MKLIEAMKTVNINLDKMADLRKKLEQCCAHSSIEPPLYEDTPAKVKEWLQSVRDIGQENIRLLCAIQTTNLATMVEIELGGKKVTKSIAEWIWRRRTYAKLDGQAIATVLNKHIPTGQLQATAGDGKIDVTAIYHFDRETLEDQVSVFNEEPKRIDMALEVVNATTDLIEN